MDLTDKINSTEIYQEPIEFICGVDTCLKEITPKVAIDFTLWLNKNEYVKAYRGLNDRMCNDWSREKTVEELFSEFLKDYNFESK